MFLFMGLVFFLRTPMRQLRSRGYFGLADTIAMAGRRFVLAITHRHRGGNSECVDSSIVRLSATILYGGCFAIFPFRSAFHLVFRFYLEVSVGCWCRDVKTDMRRGCSRPWGSDFTRPSRHSEQCEPAWQHSLAGKRSAGKFPRPELRPNFYSPVSRGYPYLQVLCAPSVRIR